MQLAALRPKAVLWDFDGVLVDTLPLHAEAWSQLLEGRGLTFDTDAYYAACGRRPEEVAAALIAGQTPPPDDDWLRAFVQEERRVFLALLRARSVPLLPGVRAWLEGFRSTGIVQAVASSTTRQIVEHVLPSLSIDAYFSVIVTNEDVEACKPAPDVFLVAAARLDIAPESCLVIEDSAHGVEAAAAAGMRCLAVATSVKARSLSGAQAVVSSLAVSDAMTILRALSRPT